MAKLKTIWIVMPDWKRRKASTTTWETDSSSAITPTSFMYTENVQKWMLDPAVDQYRDLFVKRVKQMFRTERSHILAKSSKRVVVFETKVGKANFMTEGNDLLFVASHDNVSQLMRLVEDSQNRNHRRLSSGDEDAQGDPLAARRNAIEREAILNLLCNAHTKIYEVCVNGSSSQPWAPEQKLTREELDVVETDGTVLLLGQGGTGKTTCTADRMDHDRQQMQYDSSFRKLWDIH